MQLLTVSDPRTGGTAVHLSAAAPQVRVRNDELALPGAQNFQPDASTASVAGDYFVAVELQPVSADLVGVVLPLQLDVAVDGAPSGQPVFASTGSSSASPSTPPGPPDSTAGPSTPPADPGSTAIPGLLLAGAGLVVLLGVGGAVVAVALRRRRSNRPGA